MLVLFVGRFHSSASSTQSEPLESWFWIASHVGSMLVGLRGSSVLIVFSFVGGMYMLVMWTDYPSCVGNRGQPYRHTLTLYWNVAQRLDIDDDEDEDEREQVCLGPIRGHVSHGLSSLSVRTTPDVFGGIYRPLHSVGSVFLLLCVASRSCCGVRR